MLQALHLGTNAIRLPNGQYMAIFHGLSALSAREYLNFVYIFEGQSPWGITAVRSEPLELPLGTVGSGFAFTTNLAWLDGKVVVSYCVKDRTSSFFVTSMRDLAKDLRAVA